MTKGAVIFAQNNGLIDYVKLAIFAAKRIIKYLDIPVTLITDSRNWLEEQYPDHPFDQVIDIPSGNDRNQKLFHDGSLSASKAEWKNLSRNLIYRLTPYDTTLVVDSDYVISSSILKETLNNDHDFQIYRDSIDLAGWRDQTPFLQVSQYTIPFYWATVFVFKKNKVTESFFDIVSHIKENWLYYSMLYSTGNMLFRNDYAFSIAIHIMNGKTQGDFAVNLPGTMTFITEKDILVDAVENKLKFLVEKKGYNGEYLLTKTEGIDVHVMNKHSLARYIDGGQGV